MASQARHKQQKIWQSRVGPGGLHVLWVCGSHGKYLGSCCLGQERERACWHPCCATRVAGMCSAWHSRAMEIER